VEFLSLTRPPDSSAAAGVRAIPVANPKFKPMYGARHAPCSAGRIRGCRGMAFHSCHGESGARGHRNGIVIHSCHIPIRNKKAIVATIHMSRLLLVVSLLHCQSTSNPKAYQQVVQHSQTIFETQSAHRNTRVVLNALQALSGMVPVRLFRRR
jgi:hypothetical protein